MKLHTRDLIAFFVLLMCFILFLRNYDGWIQGLASLIVGYYFSKRVYEETHNNKTKK